MSQEEWCCPICLDSNTDNCYTLEPCNHKFHTKCIIDCLRLNGPQCPYCRGYQNTNVSTQNINDLTLENELLNAFFPIHDLSNNTNFDPIIGSQLTITDSTNNLPSIIEDDTTFDTTTFVNTTIDNEIINTSSYSLFNQNNGLQNINTEIYSNPS